MKLKKILSICTLVICLLALFAFDHLNNRNSFEIIKNLEIFNAIYKEINKSYVDELDPSEMMEVAIDAMLKRLDPYTRYVTESDIERYRYLSEGRYEGLGARVKMINDYVTIIEPYEEGPAFNAGLIAGDQLVKIDDVELRGMTIDEVRDLMNSYPSNILNVKIKRFGQDDLIEAVLNRQEVDTKNVPFFGMVNEKIGYVILTSFSANASNNVRGAVAELKMENPELEGIILDLRNNGGGLLREAVGLCNIFIPSGELVVSTQNKVPEWSKEYRTKSSPLDTDLKLAVLINGRSASASEIVSGVMQDYDRGVLVGQRSFGKGLVQNTKPLIYNTQLKITTSKYYIPSGRCIQGYEYGDEGESIDIADEQRNEFRTRNDRLVFDGGGVTPDVKIVEETDNDFIRQLEKENILLFFATQYYLNNLEKEINDDFRFEDLDSFKKFLADYDLSEKFGVEQELEKLKEGITSLYGKKVFDDELEAIRTKMKSLQGQLIDDNAEMLKHILSNEIVLRYKHRSGFIPYSLGSDKDVLEATRILLDDKQYRLLLKK